MPKLLIYETSKGVWIFLIFGTDQNENRIHVHVGRKDTKNYCKIWLEPKVEVAKDGDLTKAQLKEVVELAGQYREKLISQWKAYMKGTMKLITIKK